MCFHLCLEYAAADDAVSYWIIQHADILRKWKKHEDAIKLYRRSVESDRKPTIDDYRLAAYGLATIGGEHNQEAAELYLRSIAADENPTKENIRAAAEGVIQLGSEYVPTAMQIYSRLAAPKDILEAAAKLLALGANYHGSVAELYKHVGEMQPASTEDIKSAAEGLIDLGSEYYSVAGSLYERAVSIDKNPSKIDFLTVGTSLKVLASHFPEGSNERELYTKKGEALLAIGA